MQLTPNFTLEEFEVTSTRFNNTAPQEFIPRLLSLAKTLEIIRALANKPIKISSGYRSKAVNDAVGGKPSSAHTLGYAADISIEGMTAKEIVELVKSHSSIKFDQCIEEYKVKTDSKGKVISKTEWVHFSVDPRFRQQVFTLVNGRAP